jgi:hypothetical protein
VAIGISLNGWVVPPPRLKTFDIPGTTRRVTLDSDAGRLLVALAADYDATVRPIDKGTWDEGGYNLRKARNAPRWSNHASGSAIDLNWSEEGALNSAWGKRFFAQAKTRLAVAKIKARYGKCVQWGGDWRTLKDYMHWEIKPGTTRVQVRALADKLGIDDNGKRRGA